MAKSTIVTDEQLRQVSDAIASMKTLDDEIRLAKLAGIDVTEAEKRAGEARTQLSRIKNAYGPGTV